MKNTTLVRLPDGKIQIDIPELSREYIKTIINRVRYYVPDEGLAYDLTPIEPIDRSFTWELGKATSQRIESLMEPIHQTDAYHTYGYYGFFKPSIAEVLASIPEDMIDKVSYFSLKGPQTADDLNKERDITDAGYHHSRVTWYK